ncbi:MAG: Dialkylrecorsinol condensing enzyme [uncultured Aureispira sp.]|uniref:Dialkylrecorsinol condensing enzyme n=1 Tax=uncultured Aureispira sp. TaxID=1331704 RepID=A0A6S6UD34_9BACT|nr:MAG: Dialkylrecorsinol condensing enzyme [uncultured Aureispira sp.]
MKRILVIGYSQSGQLYEILENFLKPFEGVEIEQVKIEPKEAFPFPWTSDVFFDTMPESVLEEPVDLAPYTLKSTSYDLIIVGYQPWYLSPSIPTTSLLKDPKFLSILKNTPVVTVIGARNMWLNAQESVVGYIEGAGGKVVGNVPLVDRHQNLVSVLSILHWMLTGKKERKWGVLATPGVSDKDIKGVEIFGKKVFKGLQKGTYKGLQEEILAEQTIDIHPSILLVETRGKILFLAWAKLIKKKGAGSKKRSFWVSMYKYYLLVALFIVSPIVLTIYTLLIRPFTGKSIQKKTEHFLYLGIDRT